MYALICYCFSHSAQQVLMYYWVPLYPDHPVWGFHEKRHVLWLVLTIVHIIAWVIMFGVVLVIDYGELIGVKQVSCGWGGVWE